MDVQHTILIADDHPLFRNALFQSIDRAIEGAYLLEADSLNSSFEQLEKEPDIDLLLLDLTMPGTKGMSGLIQLRTQYPELPIVVISANDEESIIEQVKASGALGFIPKSSDMRALIDALNRVLNGNTYFPTRAKTLSEQDPSFSLLQRIESLTPQQKKVLNMLSAGLLNKQIAYELAVSEATVKAHMTAIFRKLNVRNRTQAVILLQKIAVTH